MPERIMELEFVKMSRPADEKIISMDDDEKLYYQKPPEPLISSAKDMLTRQGPRALGDTKLAIVGDRPGDLSPKSRCSLWMLWLKFSSLLYLLVILLLVLWALHQYKETQGEDELLYELPGEPSALTSASGNNGASSKALLHYSLQQPARDPEIIEWEKSTASYINGNDIEYQNRRYYVKTRGYYEVQCRLQFDTYSDKIPTKDVNVVFSVIRNTGPESNRNLMSEQTTLRPRERRGIQLGPTLFHLEAGDSVYVAVLKHQFVYPTVDNYFAMRRVE